MAPSVDDPKPIPIAYIASSAGNWGGSSRYLYTTLCLLDREKFEPLVLFPSHGPVLAEMDRMGIAYEVWGEHEPGNPLRWAPAVLRTMWRLRRHGARLLHVNHVGYWRPAEILAARLLRIPVITHLHRVLREPQPFVHYSALTIANSAFTAEASIDLSSRREVVHCSVLAAAAGDEPAASLAACRAQARRQLGMDPAATVVAFVGQVREVKGVAMFLEVARRLQRPGLCFVIAGECRDPDKYPGAYTEQRLRDEIGDCEHIRYLGYQQDVEAVYRAIDALLVPSQWDEPFGLINIEAGAQRVPVIATATGGIPEVIEHGRTGYLVERDDVDAMTRYCAELVDDPVRRAALGEAARQRVADCFTAAPVRRLEAIYRDLLESG